MHAIGLAHRAQMHRRERQQRGPTGRHGERDSTGIVMAAAGRNQPHLHQPLQRVQSPRDGHQLPIEHHERRTRRQ